MSCGCAEKLWRQSMKARSCDRCSPVNKAKHALRKKEAIPVWCSPEMCHTLCACTSLARKGPFVGSLRQCVELASWLHMWMVWRSRGQCTGGRTGPTVGVGTVHPQRKLCTKCICARDVGECRWGSRVRRNLGSHEGRGDGSGHWQKDAKTAAKQKQRCVVPHARLWREGT